MKKSLVPTHQSLHVGHMTQMVSVQSLIHVLPVLYTGKFLLCDILAQVHGKTIWSHYKLTQSLLLLRVII